MNSSEFGWESLLHTDAPPECTLKAALLTTYDRADEILLVEHLLPLLLRLNREPDGEGAERQYFLLELDGRLKQLHDKLVVVSSTAREEETDPELGESGTYGWIWRSHIRHLTVGSRRRAVQHAKLWVFHWAASDEDSAEYVEIVVSSANLTRNAFKGQLQAVWRACIELRPERSTARLARWGILPEFLRELAASADDNVRLTPFIELLARADRPAGVTFVASVPGTHSREVLRRTPWGSAGLRKITPPGRGVVSVAILCPFVGSWSADTLGRWCARFDGSPDRLELVWIDRHHPWAREKRWLLPKVSLKTLAEAGATLLHLRFQPDEYEETTLFHEEHRSADERWSHAKVYLLKRGTSRRLLVTSANFSTSAWGSQSRDGELTIENFELGVCLDQATWPFSDLGAFNDEKDAATVAEAPRNSSTLITWARAAWDGKNVVVACRCEAHGALEGAINGGADISIITDWTRSPDERLRSAQVAWTDTSRPPSFVQLTFEHESLRIMIFDERSSKEREDTLPLEVDSDLAQMMRDQLLFEQYEGLVAGDGSADNDPDQDVLLTEGAEAADSTAVAVFEEEETPEGEAGRSDSYAVPAFELARRHLGVVDNWADQLNRATKRGMGDSDRQFLRRDGELLIEAFRRQALRDEKRGPASAIGARLAAEELTLRLNHLAGA